MLESNTKKTYLVGPDKQSLDSAVSSLLALTLREYAQHAYVQYMFVWVYSWVTGFFFAELSTSVLCNTYMYMYMESLQNYVSLPAIWY